MGKKDKTIMRLCIYGAPGAGKGTLCELLEDKYHIAHIATGKIFRDIIHEKSLLGQTLRELLAHGDLVSDELTIQIIEHKMKETDLHNGFIIDGFPRTIRQAVWTYHSLKIDLFLFLELDFDLIRERISGRRVHPGSDRVYHLIHHPPKIANKDDITGEDLIQREDDTVKMINHRLDLYKRNSTYIYTYIKNKFPYIVIDSSKSPEYMLAQCKEAFEKILNEKFKDKDKST